MIKVTKDEAGPGCDSCAKPATLSVNMRHPRPIRLCERCAVELVGKLRAAGDMRVDPERGRVGRPRLGATRDDTTRIALNLGTHALRALRAQGGNKSWLVRRALQQVLAGLAAGKEYPVPPMGKNELGETAVFMIRAPRDLTDRVFSQVGPGRAFRSASELARAALWHASSVAGAAVPEDHP